MELRKLKLFAFMILALLACASCGDDDDNPEIGNSVLVGRWRADLSSPSDPYAGIQFEFKSNGKGALYNDDDYVNFTWTATSDVITVKGSVGGVTQTEKMQYTVINENLLQYMSWDEETHNWDTDNICYMVRIK